MRCIIALTMFIAAPVLVSMLSTSVTLERSDVDVAGVAAPQSSLARFAGFARVPAGSNAEEQ